MAKTINQYRVNPWADPVKRASIMWGIRLAGKKRRKQMPHRIQRKRSRGWKMPPNTIYVGRPTKWGNPFPVGNGVTAATAVAYYRSSQCLHALIISFDLLKLRGKNLACWCALDQPCHADVLLELANERGG
jgi:hypothetical protein